MRHAVSAKIAFFFSDGERMFHLDVDLGEKS
jgi:hypothetical protein